MLLSGGYQKTNARVIADSITSIIILHYFFSFFFYLYLLFFFINIVLFFDFSAYILAKYLPQEVKETNPWPWCCVYIYFCKLLHVHSSE